MKILAFETSCDETGVTALEGSIDSLCCTILGNALASQIELHAQYGGVFPAMAKRAHAEKIIPLTIQSLTQAKLLQEAPVVLSEGTLAQIASLTERDQPLGQTLITFLQAYAKPDIDAIAVTTGPGLEPALWVGITTARVLSAVWDVPLIPINHMEGHVLVSLLEKQDGETYTFADIAFPALALLVSGGHTELVCMNAHRQYEKIGATRDDAVGEAFDKVARMIGLPYPGGPAVSKLAAQFREKHLPNPFILPRPMMHSKDYDFSFSGIKTAVLYSIRDHGELTDDDKQALCAAFEDACIEVLVSKTLKAIEEFNIQTLIVGGGVAGNTYLRSTLTETLAAQFPQAKLFFPAQWLATDNSVMIAISAYLRLTSGPAEEIAPTSAIADGNLSITDGGFRK